MRLLKGFVLAICGLFTVITLLSLLMPSEVMTSRTITIASSPQNIMMQIQDLKNWKNWHPVFIQKDIFISEPSTNVGSYAEWITSGKKNHLEITGMDKNEIRFILKRPGENDMMNKLGLTNFKDSSAIQVEWSALTKLKWYPWEKFSGIFIDKMTGPGYQAALNELKSVSEQSN